jgi:hypothetical protein
MSTMGSLRSVVAATVLAMGLTGPVLAQAPGVKLVRNSGPLAASVNAAALEHSKLLTQAPAASPQRRSCKKSLAMGLAIGAGAGLAVGGGLLAATGGSDATYRILFTFTGLGAGIGGLVGGTACST